MDWSIYVIVWLLSGLAAMTIADRRGSTKPTTWFITGLLLGPVGVILSLVVRRV